MEYQGQQISMQELPGFVKGLPEGNYFLENKGAKTSSEGGLVIPRSGLIKAIQSSQIPAEKIVIKRIDLAFNH